MFKNILAIGLVLILGLGISACQKNNDVDPREQTGETTSPHSLENEPVLPETSETVTPDPEVQHGTTDPHSQADANLNTEETGNGTTTP